VRTIKLTIAATETRCGGMSEDCQFSEKHNSGCGAFAGLRTRRDGRCGYWYERLPECIAAEKEAGK
jgi:hypothetical protein